MQRSQIILMISNWKTIIIWNDCMFLFHGQIRNYHYYHSSSYLISNYFNCMGSERNIWHWSIQFHFRDDTSDQLELLLLSNRKVHFCIYIQDFWQVSLFQFVCSVLNAIAPSPMKYISTNSTVETRLATARASYPLSIHPSPYYSILFHSTHLFPFSCVQKGFKLTICCPRCPSSMIDPNIYKSFHISNPIHPNSLSRLSP